MKKDIVYTITFQMVLNNGAILQAYALAKFLQNSGYSVRIIDYCPVYFIWQVYRPAKGLRRTLKKYRKLATFRRFNNKFLPLTSKTFFSFQSLRGIDDALAFVCGSDQIWNPSITNEKVDRAFYLDFAQREEKRIAYAASTGSADISDYWLQAGPLIKKLHAVGVREKQLSESINRSDSQIRSSIVVDPSLLISDYDEVLEDDRVPEYEFLLTYVVGSGEVLDEFDSFVGDIKKKFDLPVVHIGAKEISNSDVEFDSVGPGEWVAFFKKAAFVVTNSFHGTAFSVNFHKQFLFYPNPDENLNQRQMTLLGALDLESRRVDTNQSCDSTGERIEYSAIAPRLESLVGKSQRFLLEHLGANA